MKLKLLFLAVSISMLSFSQDYNVAMKVSKSDLEKTYYEKDSTANALVIYDYGNSFIDKKTFWLRVQVKQKIKILKTDGISRGEIEVKLYKDKSSEEQIIKIRGASYNLENGQMVKTELKPSAIFEEENKDYTLVKFVLPNVKVGSVITYSYETQSRFIRKYQPWYFQGSDPVLYSEYNTSIPGNYEYNIKLVGSTPLHTNTSRIEKNCIILSNGASTGCSISKYVMKNIPAYKREKFTTTSLNYIARIEYELSIIRGFDGSIKKLTKSWADVDKELESSANFGRQISRKSLAKKVLPEEIKSIDNALTKAKAIYQFVLDNYKWNGKSERYDVSVKNLLKEKIGSSFEINLLLENLLSSEDFEVYPILMSTRANGLATKIHPVLTDFNYVILKTVIGGKNYFLDATDPYLSFGELPFKCLNQYGRLIEFENGSYWENIEIDALSSRQHKIELLSFEDDAFSGTIESKFTRYHAHNVKQRFYENSQVYREKKADKFVDIIIEDLDIIDFDKTKNEFSEKITITIKPEFIGNKIYLNPFFIKFFEENPFKLQERSYPIDFGYKDIYFYVMKINLNDKLKIVGIPDGFKYNLPNKSGSLVFNIDNNDGELILYFKVNFDMTIYPPEFYSHLKKFMNKVVEIQKNTVIVLEKQ